MYGVWDFDGSDRAELDQFVREEADALVAGEPSPGRYGLRWFGSPDVTVIPTKRIEGVPV